MNKSVIMLIFSHLLVSTLVLCQPSNSSTRANPANMTLDAKVTGIVIDAATSQPVEYASVAIYKSKDSTLVAGVVSNIKGQFVIADLPYGKFYAIISFIGYKKLKVDNFMLQPNNKISNLGTIKLETYSTDLTEVEIVGNRNTIEYRIDKKVVDISQNLNAASGTLAEALQNTPSLQTDIEGNVSLRGSTNYTVLIDGKPSVIQGSEALQQIPASIVQNVEVITNPSAKYDAEGSAGIINIIMKKQKIRGFNGVANIMAGTGNKYRGDINVNYRVSKFNFTLGADYNNMGFKMDNYQNDTKYYNDTIENTVAEGVGNFRRNKTGFKGGVDYNINNNNTLSINATIGQSAFKREFSAFNDVKTFDLVMNPLDTFFYNSTNKIKVEQTNFYSANMDYQLKFNDKGHQLIVTAFISNGPEDRNSISTIDTADYLGIKKPKQPKTDSTSQVGNEREFLTKIDYTYPFSETGKFEAGYQGKYDNTKGENRNWKNGIEDKAEYDNLNFIDNIHAGYATISNSLPICDYQLGLRAEYEKRYFKQNAGNNPMERLDWFPTVHLTKKLPWQLQLQASYTKRIRRPHDRELNPTSYYVKPNEYRKGNPNLLPEFTNSYELNLKKDINEMSYVSLEGFLRQTNNLIQQESYIINNDKFISFVNVNKDRSTGAEIMINLGLAKWFTVSTSSSAYYYQIFKGSNDSISTLAWEMSINPSFRLPTGTSVQINYTYKGPTIRSQGTQSAYFMAGIGIKQNIFKNKASITLNIRDVLGPVKSSNTTKSEYFNSYGWQKREAPIFLLSLSYRINNYKQQGRPKNEEMNGDGGGEIGM